MHKELYAWVLDKDEDNTEFPVRMKVRIGEGDIQEFIYTYEEALEMGLRLIQISIPKIDKTTFLDYLKKEENDIIP